MKKVLILLLILFLPVRIFAATGIFWYETEPVKYFAYISNENGAKALCYDIYEDRSCGEIFIPYLSKIKSSNEVFINGKLYAKFIYRKKEYYLSLNDIKIANGNFEDINYHLTDTFLLYKDAYLYSGPAYAYDKVIKVPAGTELKTNYSNTLWAYTQYNGEKGWINFHSYDTAKTQNDHSGCLKNDKFEYYLNNDLKLVETPFSNNKVVGIIPKGTDIIFNYFFQGINGISFYIEYNGIKGWVNNINDYDARGAEIYDDNGLEVMVEKGGSIFTLKELNIYSDIKKTSVIGKIPKYTGVYMNYPVFNKEGDKVYLNIKYNDVVGWVIDDDAEEEKENDCYKNYPYVHCCTSYLSYKLSKDITVKNKMNNEDEVIEKGEIIYTDLELVEEASIYFKDNVYEYVDFEGDYYDAFFEESNSFEDNQSDVDFKEDAKVELKRFEFPVSVPSEVLDSKILGVDIFLEDMDVNKLGDTLSTMQDDFISTHQDDIEVGIVFFDGVYVILGVVLILIMVIVVIKNKNKVDRTLKTNNKFENNINETNALSSKNILQEKNDINETQP